MCIVDLWCAETQDTERVGEILGRHVFAGTRIDCQGELGAGKTTFARGVLRGLGHPDPRELASPTYALHHCYEGGRLRMNHLDLYRIESTDPLLRQGVLDPLMEADSVALVEWPERLPSESGPPTISVEMAHAVTTGRRLRVTFLPEVHRELLDELIRRT